MTKLLTLILGLSGGATERITLPAWECHAAAAEMQRAWIVGGRVERDDGLQVITAECVMPTFADTLTLSSNGDCEVTS